MRVKRRDTAADTITDDEFIRRGAGRRAFAIFAAVPLSILACILSVSLLLSVFGFLVYRQVVPVMLFIAGIFVMFVGAWYDFGARRYVRSLEENRISFGEEDVNHIFKQQFWIMVMYLGIAGLYILIALAIFYL